MVKSKTIVYRKGNSYWVGDKRDAEEATLVTIYENEESIAKVEPA